MSAAFGTQAFQQSRHARRIYVGGFPPNYGDEEALKFFLNSVIAKGLGEPNDNSYVLSIYVNQKKCFAFVELRAIELATACLDLDGIIYKKVVLKVLRANEYKPELIPPSMVGAPITLDLSSFSFGIPTATSNDKITVPSAQSSITGVTTHPSASSSNDNAPDARLDSVIQFASLSYVSSGFISIIGYPFDDRASPNFNTNSSIAKDAAANGSNGGPTNANNLTSHSSSNASGAVSVPAATTGSGSGGYTGLGCTQAPKKMRNMIRKYKFGLLQNPEYDVDLKKLKFIDVGDVQAGKTREETKANLSAIVAEVVQRRAVPFVVGGSSDCAYFTAQGAMSATSRRVGVVVISAQLDDTRILEDHRMSGRLSPASTAGNVVSGGAPGLGLIRESSSHSQYTSLPSESLASAQGQGKTELDSPPGMERVLNCGGRYIRFAAQGLQCSTQQADYVTSKGGHIVWLGRDIRNQSAQCSVCATANGDNFAPLAGRAVPHVYTLALFREALRCAAGTKDVELAQARAAAEKKEEEAESQLPAIYRVESQDPFCRDNAESAAAPVAATESAPVEGAAGSEEVEPESPNAVAASPVSTPHGPPASQPESQLGGVVVSIDMGALAGAVRGCGYITGSSNSATGLTVDEILDMVMIAGADPNVLSLDISEFSPDAEDGRSSMLLAQMFYQFSLGVASRPAHPSSAAKSLGLGRALPAITSMDVDTSTSGSFMYGEAPAMMRVPFRVTVDRSHEQMQSRDLGSLSKTPKFYQEVSSGSMEAFTGTGQGAHAGEHNSGGGANLPYVEVDHRLSSMDSLDISTMSEAGSHLAYGANKNVGSSGGNSVSSKQQASPNHFVASPPTMHGSTSLSSSGSTDAFQNKQLYPTGPPQYVAHSQSQRAALQAADVAGLFGGMIRTSPSSTPTSTMRRLGSASASSPPLGNRSMTTQKSAPAGMIGVGALYPNSSTLPQRSAPHLSQQAQHQQLFAQQALHLQQQQALYAQQRPAQAPYSSRPPAAAPQYGSSASVPQGYASQQQRSRYDQEQAWSGDRGDPNQGQARYVQHSAAQRQQLLLAQHQQQQMYRMQQQAQQQSQSPLDDRSASPQYLSQDFLDLGNDRLSTGSGNNSYIGGLQGNARSSNNSTASSELSSALAGLGVGVNSGELSHSGPNSVSDKSRSSAISRNGTNLSTSNLNDMHGAFDESIDMFEYRLSQQQQQQQAQAQASRRPLQGPPAQPGFLQPSSQQNPGSLQRGSGANQTYTQSNSMYGLYNTGSNSTSFSTAEALSFASGSGSTLNNDLMSSLSSSASLLYPSSLANSTANNLGAGTGTHVASPPPRGELDAQADFMSEHYNQYS